MFCIRTKQKREIVATAVEAQFNVNFTIQSTTNENNTYEAEIVNQEVVV